MDAIHVILRRMVHLERFGASIRAMARMGAERFSEPQPPVRDSLLSYRSRCPLLIALIAFLTSIWGEGIVFTWSVPLPVVTN